VPNPADPAEDYADKWARDPRLKDNFWLWIAQVRADVEALPVVVEDGSVVRRVKSAFGIELADRDLWRFVSPGAGSAAIVARPAPAVITSGPQPWGS